MLLELRSKKVKPRTQNLRARPSRFIFDLFLNLICLISVSFVIFHFSTYRILSLLILCLCSKLVTCLHRRCSARQRQGLPMAATSLIVVYGCSPRDVHQHGTGPNLPPPLPPQVVIKTALLLPPVTAAQIIIMIAIHHHLFNSPS